MQLTPREKDKLLVAMAAEVARRRLARGVKLNHPEAIALITDAVVEICLAPERGGETSIADAIEMLASQIAGANESSRVAIASVLGRIGRRGSRIALAS